MQTPITDCNHYFWKGGRDLKKNNLKEALKEGKNVFGPFMKFADPAAVEIMGFAGFDFIIIDAEHGPISMEKMLKI